MWRYVDVRGGSPISWSIPGPDKGFGTEAEEGEASGSAWTRMDKSDMPPVDASALAAQSHQVTS